MYKTRQYIHKFCKTKMFAKTNNFFSKKNKKKITQLIGFSLFNIYLCVTLVFLTSRFNKGISWYGKLKIWALCLLGMCLCRLELIFEGSYMPPLPPHTDTHLCSDGCGVWSSEKFQNSFISNSKILYSLLLLILLNHLITVIMFFHPLALNLLIP